MFLMMKQIVFFLSLLLATSFCLLADEANQIRIEQVIHGGTHFDFPVPAVEPDVYYDDDNQEIIIVGTGNATYYNVVIESVTDWNVSISTQVNGYYDTIDISSLPADEYSITITTQWNDTFVGYFEIE